MQLSGIQITKNIGFSWFPNRSIVSVWRWRRIDLLSPQNQVKLWFFINTS